MDDIILNTIRLVAERKIHNILSQFSFDKNSGYFREHDDYSHQIGLSLLSQNIKFESRYEKGYGVIDIKNKNSDEFDKSFMKICQETPSAEFLANRLSIEEQKNYTMKIFNLFNFEQCLHSVTLMSSIDHILRDLKDVGINCTYINSEINHTFRELFKTHDIHSNQLIIFSHRGYWFEEDILETIDNKRRAATTNNLFIFKNKWEEFLDMNQSNHSIYQHLILSNTLENRKASSIKRKI